MENTETTAAELLEQFEDLVLGGLSGQQAEAARGGMLRWLAARIEDYRSRSIEEQGRQIELYLPQEIKDKFTDKPSAERFELAATAFDEWRLRALDRRIYARAQAFYEKTGDMAEMKAAAETDLRELRTIEELFQREYPQVYRTSQRIISESKVDSFYVIRDGGATSRRLGRHIARAGG